MEPRKLFAELKRRNVYKVAIAYAVRRMAADADSDAGFFHFSRFGIGRSGWSSSATDQLTRINTWLLLAKLIAQLHRLQRALTSRPIPCLFCDR